MIDYQNFKKMLLGKTPETLIILGSGLGMIADSIKNPLVIEYANIEDFPQSSVSGHQGRMIIGNIGKHEVLCLQGRFHLYEGHTPQTIAHIISLFKKIGIKRAIITNAAGSLNTDIKPGELMLIRDHINFSGQNPLIGHNDDNAGPRFPDMSMAYSAKMREQISQIANKHNIKLNSGVYLMVLGPNFETPAEIRAFRVLGADAVGMSTVPEVISCVHAGIEVVAISAISNFGSGMQIEANSHQETLEKAGMAASDLGALICNYLEEF